MSQEDTIHYSEIKLPPFYSQVRAEYLLNRPEENSCALFGADTRYRYRLWRLWASETSDLPVVKWIMLNPSTADSSKDDPTIRKCKKFARRWGYGGIFVANLFALRATNPKELYKVDLATAIGPGNDGHILQILASHPGPNIAAWGQHGNLGGRAKALMDLCKAHEIKLQALKIAKDGVTPWHPLYLKDDSIPFDL
jgi:hypothetical protein